MKPRQVGLLSKPYNWMFHHTAKIGMYGGVRPAILR